VSADLERRYTRLLHLYPAAYRRARGAELLETLLESAEQGRTRPAAREVAALVLGALRAYAGRDRRQSTRLSWLVAFRAAALMLLVYDLAERAVAVAFDASYGGPSIWTPFALALTLVALTLGACAVGAVLRGRYGIAVATATAAFVATLVVTLSTGDVVFGGLWGFPLAIALLVPLLRHRPPPAAGLVRYAPVLPLLLVLVDQGASAVLPGIAGILQRGAVLALCAGSLLWLAVDERLAMAVGLLVLNTMLIQTAFLVGGGVRSPAGAAVAMAITGFAPVVLLLASATTARRRARI